MVPMFECTNRIKLCRAKNHKFGDETTVECRYYIHTCKMNKQTKVPRSGFYHAMPPSTSNI